MLIENIIKKQLLIFEEDKKLANLSKNITVDFGIYKKDHVTLRQTRHVNEKEGPCAGKKITDGDMVSLINDSLKIVAKKIISGGIKNRNPFIITREGNDYLNVVITPEKNEYGIWNLKIKTVMCEKEFRKGVDQLQIIVP